MPLDWKVKLGPGLFCANVTFIKALVVVTPFHPLRTWPVLYKNNPSDVLQIFLWRYNCKSLILPPEKLHLHQLGESRRQSFTCCQAGPDPYPSHITGFWYPLTPGELLAGWDAPWCAGGRIGPLQQKSLLFYYYHEVAKLNSLNVLFDKKRSLKTVTW